MHFMRESFFLAICGWLVVGCATAPPAVKRLNPIGESAPAPRDCRIVSVFKDSPAYKAGIAVGEVMQSVNGAVPKDASGFADLVNQSQDEASLAVVNSSGAVRLLKVRLRSTRPRLGAVCDLTGLRKLGLTAAGNESLTVFQGPYALTASGIIDKGIVFLRVRVTNNADSPLQVSPELFTAQDGTPKAVPILSPKQVMCMLYGDKGARLLALKKRRRETPDADTFSDREPLADDTCAGVTGRLAGTDPRYAEANAEYIATESLWPATLNPGDVADGLIYLAEPAALPIELRTTIQDRAMRIALGQPRPSEKQMKESDLVQFFETLKRGAPLRLTLRKGRVFVGKFASYDSVEERVWFDTPRAGMLSSTSFPLTSIRSAEPIEPQPAKPAAGEHVN
jgi:hypothetical protein